MPKNKLFKMPIDKATDLQLWRIYEHAVENLMRDAINLKFAVQNRDRKEEFLPAKCVEFDGIWLKEVQCEARKRGMIDG